MAALPAGRFTSERWAWNKEQSRHYPYSVDVEVEPFCLDLLEVATRDYQACVDAGTCDDSRARVQDYEWKSECNLGDPRRELHPANCMSWEKANAYCVAKGMRLPSEEEWEWAARGAAAANTFPWGNTSPQDNGCWAGRPEPYGSTCPVGQFPADTNPFGHMDLAGNVREWTSSEVNDGDPSPSGEPGGYVVRGGHYHADHPSLRAVQRGVYSGTHHVSTAGFRCAMATE